MIFASICHELACFLDPPLSFADSPNRRRFGREGPQIPHCRAGARGRGQEYKSQAVLPIELVLLVRIDADVSFLGEKETIEPRPEIYYTPDVWTDVSSIFAVHECRTGQGYLDRYEEGRGENDFDAVARRQIVRQCAGVRGMKSISS